MAKKSKAKIFLLALLVLAAPLQAETIKFAWDKPTGGGAPTGYRFYISPVMGEYGPANATLPASAVTYTFLVPEKMAGKSFYATVTAYNAQGESERSNELLFVTKPRPGAASGLKVLP